MTQAEAIALRRKHPNQRAAARAACMRTSAFSAILRGETDTDAKPSAHAKPRADKPVRTIADFRREHDQSWKIKDGLARLFGGGIIMTDAEFREAVGANPSRWRAAAEQTEFRENRYRVNGETLWASKSTIRDMRSIRGEAV